jgi:dienelactone hydrolase
MIAGIVAGLIMLAGVEASTCCPDPVNLPDPATAQPDDLDALRADVRNNFQTVAGTIPDAPDTPPDYVVKATIEFPAYTRQSIVIDTGAPGAEELTAYLLMPKDISDPVPGLLCLHPTYVDGKNMVVGLGDKPNRNYAEELAKRGYVTLAPDYPGFGDHRPDPYAAGWSSATALGIYNHRRCVDLLQSLEQVDGERIGCIGHSLGGHNTLFVGLFDDRIDAMVTSCGFNRFDHYYGGNLKGWSHKGYMPRIASEYDTDPAKMPWDFPQLLTALAPRAVFVNAPINDANFEVEGVRLCEEAARPIYQRLDARDHLRFEYPDAEHDFPTPTREAAYEFLDRALR